MPTEKVLVQWRKHGYYVYLLSGKLTHVKLPGDLLDITEKLNAKDKRTLEGKAIFRQKVLKGVI